MNTELGILLKEIAVNAGFKLKEQKNGELDLNPYVYEFGMAAFSIGLKASLEMIKADISESSSEINEVFNKINDAHHDTKLKIIQSIRNELL